MNHFHLKSYFTIKPHRVWFSCSTTRGYSHNLVPRLNIKIMWYYTERCSKLAGTVVKSKHSMNPREERSAYPVHCHNSIHQEYENCVVASHMPKIPDYINLNLNKWKGLWSHVFWLQCPGPETPCPACFTCVSVPTHLVGMITSSQTC